MELWKPVVNFEDSYEVSDRGRVRSIDRKVASGIRHNDSVMRTGKILKYNVKRNGYAQISLSRNGKVKSIGVHRLVAMAFIENPESKATVNHKNGNKLDNRAENLEWATQKENSQHAYDTGLFPPNTNKKKIICKDTMQTFDGSYDAAVWLNRTKFGNSKDVKSMARKIRAACCKTQKSAYGFHWEDVV